MLWADRSCCRAYNHHTTSVLVFALFLCSIRHRDCFLFRPRLPAYQCHHHHAIIVSSQPTALSVSADRLRAFPQQTPHSGRHFRPTHPSYSRRRRLHRHHRRRFTEGWYYRLTLPPPSAASKNNNHTAVSFAFILSIEDPGRRKSPRRLVCIQVIGPNDDYLVQGSRDDTRLWAWKHQQGLGCTFSTLPPAPNSTSTTGGDVPAYTTALDRQTWIDTVESGFQILPTEFLGRVKGRDGTVVQNIVEDEEERNHNTLDSWPCNFDFTVRPLVGWGGASQRQQRSTAGWLSHWPIFEPHWQITMADGRATGVVEWKNKTYRFSDAPFYAEKNWGAALPEKWYWTQCNAFPGYSQLSVVAGGGIRQIPLGKKEALGMVAVHWDGHFFEAVPWMGGMAWSVDTWGRWILTGNSTFGERPFAVQVVYECDPNTGLIFRAPTPEDGLVRFCKDTFEANCTLSLWTLEKNAEGDWVKVFPPIINRAVSRQGGAEVGGGPWWDTWEGQAKVKEPIQRLLRIPLYWNKVKSRIRRLLSNTPT